MPDDTTPLPGTASDIVAPARVLVDVPSTPIPVDPSVVGASAAMAARQVALIVGGGVSILGFLKGHDWTGLIGWIEGDGAATASVAVVTVGVFLYGQWKLFKDKAKALLMGRNVDNRIAKVKGEI